MEKYTYQEQELTQPAVVIEDDLTLRYRAIADTLGIPVPPEMEGWLLDRTDQLTRLICQYSSSPMVIEDMEVIKEELTFDVQTFRNQTLAEGNIPFVVSFDPLLIQEADYTIQENRVKLLEPDNPIIDFAAAPENVKANRFAEATDNPKCGAGKLIDEQLADIWEQLDGLPLENVRLAVADGSIISGRTILRFLEKLPPQLRENGVLAIMGSTSQKGIALMNEKNVAVSALKVFDAEPAMTMTISDIVPTLGGRMIAQKDIEGSPRPLTTPTQGTNLTMAVDAILGGYPTHVDVDPADAELVQQLGQWALQTGYGFWQSLEALRGAEISWEDLQALNGMVKVMLPMRNMMSTERPSNEIPESPKAAVMAAARYGY